MFMHNDVFRSVGILRLQQNMHETNRQTYRFSSTTLGIDTLFLNSAPDRLVKTLHEPSLILVSIEHGFHTCFFCLGWGVGVDTTLV